MGGATSGKVALSCTSKQAEHAKRGQGSLQHSGMTSASAAASSGLLPPGSALTSS